MKRVLIVGHGESVSEVMVKAFLKDQVPVIHQVNSEVIINENRLMPKNLIVATPTVINENDLNSINKTV